MRTQHKACILIWRENRCVLFCFGVSCRNSTNAEVVMGVGSRLCRYSLFPPRWGQLLSYTCQKSSYNSKKRKEKIKFETWWNIIPLAASASVWALCLCALYGYCILSVCVEEFSRQICPFWSTISRKALAPNMFALSWNPYSYLNGKLHVFWVSTRRRTRNATQTFSERRECFSYVIPVLTKRSIVQSFFYVCVFFMAKWRNPDTLEQFK